MPGSSRSHKSSMPNSLKDLRYIKYYSLSSTIGLEHFSNFISNNCQNISSTTGSEAKLSEN